VLGEFDAWGVVQKLLTLYSADLKTVSPASEHDLVARVAQSLEEVRRRIDIHDPARGACQRV
jgi:hypothetical protein